MNAVATPHRGQMVEEELTPAETSARLTTSLYDVIATLQTVVEPHEDDLVVAVVVHWQHAKRLTRVRDVTIAA